MKKANFSKVASILDEIKSHLLSHIYSYGDNLVKNLASFSLDSENGQ